MSDWIHVYEPGTSGWTLLLLHGTGGNEQLLLGLGRALAPRVNLLSPRGPVLENGMPRFFRRLAEGVFDEADIARRAGELKAFVADSAAQYGFDAERVIALGHSNGANIAAAALLLEGAMLTGGVLLRPMVPLVPRDSPDLSSVKLWVGAGRRDPLVPVENTERLVTMLQGCGAEVTLNWHAGGHGVAQDELPLVRDWLEANFADL